MAEDFCFVCGHVKTGHDEYHARYGDKHQFLPFDTVGKNAQVRALDAATTRVAILEGEVARLRAVTKTVEEAWKEHLDRMNNRGQLKPDVEYAYSIMFERGWNAHIAALEPIKEQI